MYKHISLRRFKYLLRIDEDITSFYPSPTQFDWLNHLEHRGLENVNVQRAMERAFVMKKMCTRGVDFFIATGIGNLGGLQRRFCLGNEPWLNCGYIEMYLQEVFTRNEYIEFLEWIDFIEGVYILDWREQSYKTMWIETVVPINKYEYLRNQIPALKHKGQNFW